MADSTVREKVNQQEGFNNKLHDLSIHHKVEKVLDLHEIVSVILVVELSTQFCLRIN